MITEQPALTQQHKLSIFYWIILTQTISMIGSRISGLAIGFHIFVETQQATPLALVSFFAVLPMVLASGVSGVLADRWDRRKVMMLADTGQAVGTLLLLISFTSGSFQVWHLYVITFFGSICAAFQSPAFGASVTMLVPDHQRNRANVLMQLSQPAAGIIAPAIAGLVYAAFSVTGAIVIDLLTFVLAIVAIYRVQIPQPKLSDEAKALQGSIWREAFGGLAYLWQRRTLFMMMLHISLLNFLFAGSMSIANPYILLRTDQNTQVLGVVVSLFNLGGLIGGVIYGIWGGTKLRIHTIMPGIMLSGAMMIALGISQTPLALAAALFLLLFPIPMINAASSSMMQQKVPADLQGRVFATMGQLSMLLTPLSYLMIGPLADRVFEPAINQSQWQTVAPLVGNSAGAGIGLIYVLFGSLVVVTTIIMYVIPHVRNIEIILPDYVAESAGEGQHDKDPEAATVPAPAKPEGALEAI
jgi:MFS family permease